QGHRAAAAQAQVALNRVTAQTGHPPILVARYYMTAALYAFYLPNHPIVANAATQLDKQPTSYDFWPDTNLASTGLLGQTLLLDNQGRGSKRPWGEVLRFTRLEPLDDGAWFVGEGYQGM